MALVDADAAGVTVQTLHGLAMRLTGTSYAVAIERGEQLDFDAVIRQATRQLTAAGKATARAPKRASAPPSCATACSRACASCWSTNTRTSTASTTS